MLWVDVLLILLFAFLLSGFLTWGLRWRHPARMDAFGVSLLFLFLILLFSMWAGSLWLRPWGPAFYGSPWLFFLIIGLLVSLLILSVGTPNRRPLTREEAVNEAKEAVVTGVVFSAFFWVLIISLLVAILVSYI